MSQIARFAIGLIVTAVLMAGTFQPMCALIQQVPFYVVSETFRMLAPDLISTVLLKVMVIAAVLFAYLGVGLLISELLCFAYNQIVLGASVLMQSLIAAITRVAGGKRFSTPTRFD
jgi:hypothetical protein